MLLLLLTHFSRAQLCVTLWRQPARLFCPWGSPGKGTRVGCHALLQGILQAQGLKPGLLHCRQTLYVNPPGKPIGVESQSLIRGDLPDSGIKPGSPALQEDSSPSEPPGTPWSARWGIPKSSWLFYSLNSPCVHAYVISHLSQVRLFETLWTVARHAPLSMWFSRQECCSGLPCSPPGDLTSPGIAPALLRCLALAGRFFTSSAPWEIP